MLLDLTLCVGLCKCTTCMWSCMCSHFTTSPRCHRPNFIHTLIGIRIAISSPTHCLITALSLPYHCLITALPLLYHSTFFAVTAFWGGEPLGWPLGWPSAEPLAVSPLPSPSSSSLVLVPRHRRLCARASTRETILDPRLAQGGAGEGGARVRVGAGSPDDRRGTTGGRTQTEAHDPRPTQ